MCWAPYPMSTEEGSVLGSLSRVSDPNGVSLLQIMLEIHHSGWEPSLSMSTEEGSVLGSLSMSTEEGSVLGSLSHVHRRRSFVGLLILCPQKKVVCWAPYPMSTEGSVLGSLSLVHRR